MSKKIIAVDVDDVLAISAVAWVRHSNERWGMQLAVDDYLEDWATMWQVDHETAIKRKDELFSARTVGDFDSDVAAREVLEHLSERYELVVATSRHSQLREETAEWLDKHFNGIFSNLHMTGIFDDWVEGAHMLTKADLVENIRADYLIDDQAKHCVGVAERGVTAILFGDYAWNRNEVVPESVVRCANWGAVKAYFDGQD